MVQLFPKDAPAVGASVGDEGELGTDIVKCPDCEHMLGKVAPAPATKVSFQCPRCKRLVWYVIPPIKVLEEAIRRAKAA